MKTIFIYIFKNGQLFFIEKAPNLKFTVFDGYLPDGREWYPSDVVRFIQFHQLELIDKYREGEEEIPSEFEKIFQEKKWDLLA